MNNSFNHPPAGPVRRILALTYDTLMVAAITLTYVLVMSIVTVAITSTQIGEAVVIYHAWWYRLGLVAVNVGFFVFFWQRDGQTIGMRAWRLKLIDNEGNNPSIKQCLLRCLLAPISIAILFGGYWWCWIDKEGRALHDRLTKTHVLLMPKRKNNKENAKIDTANQEK